MVAISSDERNDEVAVLATEGHGGTWPFRHGSDGRLDSGRMNVCNSADVPLGIDIV